MKKPPDSMITEPLIPRQDIASQSYSRRKAAKEVASLAVPIALSYTFSFSMVALGLMAGRIGENEQENEKSIAASALIITMLNAVAMMAISGLYSVSLLTGKYYGKLTASDTAPIPDKEHLENKVSATFKSSLALSVPLATAAFFPLYYSKSILVGFGQNEEIATLAESYLRPFSAAMPGFLLRMCEEQVMLGFKKQIPAMVLALSSFGIGTLIANILCFNLKHGLPGIAYGYIIEPYLTSLFCGLYIAYEKTFKNFQFFRDFKKEDFNQIKKLVRIGWPMALTFSMEWSALLVLSVLAGLLGENQLAAYGVAAQFTSLTLIPVFAFAQATGQEMSRQIGERQFFNASRVGKYGLLTSLGLISPFCILVFVYPEILALISTSGNLSQEVLKIISILGPITAVGVAVDSVRYNVLQALRATGVHVTPAAISIAFTWVGVLLSYVLGFHTKLDVYGISTGFVGGLLMATLAMLPKWFKNLGALEQQTAEARIVEIEANLTEEASLLNAPPPTAGHLISNASV